MSSYASPPSYTDPPWFPRVVKGLLLFIVLAVVFIWIYEGLAPAAIESWEGVYIGMPADDVLKIHPKSEMIGEPEVLGRDAKGMVVSWNYPGAHLILKIRRDGCPEGSSLSSCNCYRVMEIHLR